MIFGRRKNDLAVVVTHFNWCGFTTPTRNLHRFVRYIESLKIPIYGVELSLSDKFETVDYPNWKRIKVDRSNICFQKEACVNLAVKDVPSEFTKIAWIDHDLFFSNTNWVEDASKKLDDYKAIQLFSNYAYTDGAGRKTGRTRPAMVKSIGINKNDALSRRIGMPGCAWAARRELWENGGLYPFSFLGGGDTLFVYTIMNTLQTEKIHHFAGLKDRIFLPYKRWAELINKYISEKDVSYIDGTIIHEWHGDSTHRKYDTRYGIVSNLNFDDCICLDKNGLVQIINVDHIFYNSIYEYFVSRNEDGVLK